MRMVAISWLPERKAGAPGVRHPEPSRQGPGAPCQVPDELQPIYVGIYTGLHVHVSIRNYTYIEYICICIRLCANLRK